jgi:hypothetical protein
VPQEGRDSFGDAFRWPIRPAYQMRLSLPVNFHFERCSCRKPWQQAQTRRIHEFSIVQ